jgi:hypothetical protein
MYDDDEFEGWYDPADEDAEVPEWDRVCAYLGGTTNGCDVRTPAGELGLDLVPLVPFADSEDRDRQLWAHEQCVRRAEGARADELLARGVELRRQREAGDYHEEKLSPPWVDDGEGYGE